MNKKILALCVVPVLLLIIVVTSATTFIEKSNAELLLQAGDDDDGSNNNIPALQSGPYEGQLLLQQQQGVDHERNSASGILDRERVNDDGNNSPHRQQDSSLLLSGSIENIVLIGTILVIVSVAGYAGYNVLRIKEKSRQLKRTSTGRTTSTNNV
jgi:hypothetical protein